MSTSLARREFLKTSAALGASALLPWGTVFAQEKKPLFEISLAEWSLHTTLNEKKLDNRDFAKTAKEQFGIHAIEYVNQFFMDKATDRAYIADLKKRADDLEVKTLLIMIDKEGDLGDADEAKRTKAVENHYKWVEAAKQLGCHSIRVNAKSSGSFEEQQERAADGLRRLSEFGDQHGLNVIVENHGGLSSNGEWLAGTIKKANHPRCGTLPDFGNFTISKDTMEEYDRYKGTQELMPFAKGVSAKSYDFDEQGNETKIDYVKMLKIVLDAGYHGHVGIEYEGKKLSEPDGIKATKALLERVRDQLASA